MKRIGDRSFMFAWQLIRAASQPNPEATTWHVAGVQWHRHRYSHAAPDYAVAIEVHRLDHIGGADAWSLMVVAENWWDQRRKPLRSSIWATHLSGSRFRIEEWVMQQSKALDPGSANLKDCA